MAGLLSSCEVDKNNPEWQEQYKEAEFIVVQFKPLLADYKLNTMLVPDAQGKFTMRKLQNGGTCREFIYAKNPFIKVDTVQNWYIADWKWGLNISYSHSVLYLQWTDVRQPDAVYVRSDFSPVANNIIERYGVVKRSDIDKWLNIEPTEAPNTPGSWGFTTNGISTDHIAPVYLSRYFSVQDVPEVIDTKGNWKYTKQDFLQERLRQDSLQEVYRIRLAQLIYDSLANKVIVLK
ncbi:MAG: hypothetical protein J5612_04790 [Paludibacteraceae bacterium]|nr:hypothetical protein [Paludibacteraceae bacterium]